MTLILHSSVANNYANATIVTLGNIMHFRQAKSVIYKDVLICFEDRIGSALKDSIYTTML